VQTIAEKTYKVGEVRQGKIVRVQDFGAFVELEPGIEALAHSSTFAPTGTSDGWKKASTPGTTGEFEILTIDPARKRIGVAFLGDGSWRARSQAGQEGTQESGEPGAREGTARTGPAGRPARSAAGAPRRTEVRTGERITGKVERHESFGVFIYLGPGRTGLLPAAETGTQRGADLKKAFPVGSELEVLVLDVDPAGRRIRLSRKALLDVEERADARDFASRQQVKESFGSIGEKLRAALAARQK
jgi:small subunit ribosomal protein S1